MFQITDTIKEIIASALILAIASLSLYSWHEHTQNTIKDKDIELLKSQAQTDKGNLDVCHLETTHQNEAIQALADEDTKNQIALEKWKALPPQIKYVEVYKYQTIVKDSNECSDIKAALDDIRHTSF